MNISMCDKRRTDTETETEGQEEGVEGSMRSMESANPQEIDRIYHNYCRKRKRRMARTPTAPEALISPMESGNQDKCGHGNTNSNSHTTVVASTSHGSISVIGRRRVMEDAVKIIPAFMGDYDFFAVYYGHGGAAVANACQERLHMLVAEEVAVAERGLDWHKVMCSCFVRMDHEIDNNNTASASASSGELFQHSMVGSTALVLMVGRQELVVANCGDPRAVLCRGGVALPLSRDREPDRPDEGEKVETAGGRVISWNANRVLGVVASSRSIGDHCLKPFVIPEPEVNVYERAEGDEFIVVASDGLWDVISNNLACEVVRRCLDGQMRRIFKEGFIRSTCAAEAAALLAELAMVRGSKYNISVIVVQLKPSI